MSMQFKCKYGLIVKKVSILSYSVKQKYVISSIKPIDRALSGATTPGHSGPGSNGNKGVLRISQGSSITGTSLLDCLVSYPGHSLGGGLTAWQRCSQCILHPQPTGQGIRGKMLSARFQWKTATSNWCEKLIIISQQLRIFN